AELRMPSDAAQLDRGRIVERHRGGAPRPLEQDPTRFVLSRADRWVNMVEGLGASSSARDFVFDLQRLRTERPTAPVPVAARQAAVTVVRRLDDNDIALVLRDAPAHPCAPRDPKPAP